MLQHFTMHIDTTKLSMLQPVPHQRNRLVQANGWLYFSLVLYTFVPSAYTSKCICLDIAVTIFYNVCGNSKIEHVKVTLRSVKHTRSVFIKVYGWLYFSLIP